MKDVKKVDETKEVSADLSFLFTESTADDVKGRVKDMFDAAVLAEAKKIEEAKEVSIDEIVEVKLSEAIEVIDEAVEEYLDYAVKNWMTENKLAMESSMKVEMAESLLSSLKTVFEDHNIEVPEGSDSVVESLVARNDELTAELNESMKSLKALQDEVESALVESALDEACAGMADTNATKLRELSENVRYSDVGDFKTKVEGFKKSLFAEAAPVKIDVTDGGVLTEDKQAPSNVDAATQAFIDKVNSRL